MELLRVVPVNVQVRHRGTFSPPNYSLVTTEIAATLAKKLAEVFNLRSTNIVFNQNAMSTQYLSFRYILPKDPIRYLDALVGVDQAELIFLNPASVLELKAECLKAWDPIIEKSKPSIVEHYFEATLHCTPEGVGAKEFLDKFVNVNPGVSDIQQGFSLTAKKPEISGEARIGLEVSASIPDGLYLIFGCSSKKTVEDPNSLGHLFDTIIKVYREMQPLAHVEVVEAT